ncbi:MAG: exodeoxyribonuclease III [Candidatus Pacearchaeota archaeon]|jgi:exodeoxyribonuclease-3
MKIISWNVNGLRSIERKGFLSWLEQNSPEIICLQEIKVTEDRLRDEFKKLKGYNTYFNFADEVGYSGVAVFTKEKPKFVENVLGLKRFDKEGRFLRLDFSDFILINIYIPHGGRKKENLRYKIDVYKALIKYLTKLKDQKVILVGDFNIAREDIDLARPKQNKNNIMFTQEERDIIKSMVNLGFIDTFRSQHLTQKDWYTWWPYAFEARERNLGWRIDYIFITKKLQDKLKESFILTRDKGSDHCPIGIEIL